MLTSKRLLLIPPLLLLVTVAVLGLRLGFPHHRLIAFGLLALAVIPLIAAYRINRRVLREGRARLKDHTRPFLPYVVVAAALAGMTYVTWTLVPVEKSPLVDLTRADLRAEIDTDLGNYLMLRNAADDLLNLAEEGGLLERDVSSLTTAERAAIRALWRDGVMTFLEFDLLKQKYRGFFQIDYNAEPALHADAFLLVHLAYITQYDACLRMANLVGDHEFMKTLLNEPGEGVPAESFFRMKQRLTHPNVLLRLNAATAYYELVKHDATLSPELRAELKERREAFYDRMGKRPDLFLENPLRVLERAAFEVMFPVQKKVALQMSQVRTARRDYLITPEILGGVRDRLQPGDILAQRRNWHMTNVGIPGFWPHTALYVGTADEIAAFFADLDVDPQAVLAERFPEAWSALRANDADGYPNRVLESIRPGVVFQSFETSAKCDYLGVLRPNLSKEQKFAALLAAFAHHGKPYDLNFDFTTDNELVCSELVYKAYQEGGRLPFEPEVVTGRLLLPPNRMVEQAIAHLGGPDAPFSFVLFLDTMEWEDRVVERDAVAFRDSWARPKWDLLQQ